MAVRAKVWVCFSSGLLIACLTATVAHAYVAREEMPYASRSSMLTIDEAPLRSLTGAALAQTQTMYIDGVSDQSPPQWSDLPGEEDGFGPASHITLARYVVQWNVSSGDYPAYRSELDSWYADVLALRLTPEVSLASYDGVMPVSVGEYHEMLEQLLDTFPAIRYLEAWDEPNATTGLDANTAARYTNVAHSLCQPRGCTVIAGNLLDSDPHMAGYERAYERALDPVESDWGIHPYQAVATRNPATVLAFKANLPDGGIDENLWFTEVGAYECEDIGGYRRLGQHSQAVGASWLVNRLMPEVRPVHVFYYELMFRSGQQPPCDRGDSDTALYVPTGDPRAPYAPREAASYIADDRATLPPATAPAAASASTTPASPGG
jgi:hypothetical protein